MLYGEEPLQQVAYVHDGTLEGLLSAVFLAYERHEDPEDIVPEALYEPRLGQHHIERLGHCHCGRPVHAYCRSGQGRGHLRRAR